MLFVTFSPTVPTGSKLYLLKLSDHVMHQNLAFSGILVKLLK